MVKASDISDAAFLDALRASLASWGTATRMDVEARLPQYPWKVVLAKARSLEKRGLIDGCMCGCRGDWSIVAPAFTEKETG